MSMSNGNQMDAAKKVMAEDAEVLFAMANEFAGKDEEIERLRHENELLQAKIERLHEMLEDSDPWLAEWRRVDHEKRKIAKQRNQKGGEDV